MIDKVLLLAKRCFLVCFGIKLNIRVQRDCKSIENGRIFIQIIYDATCSKTGVTDNWRGRKWYLSEYMTDDEIIKTIYSAFKSVIEHEAMEGFKVDEITLFNPHINFEELLKVSNKEIQRK